MTRKAAKLLSALLVLLVAVTPFLSICALSSDVSDSEQAQGEFVMTLNPEERYTGGDAYTENEVKQQQNSASKAIYIGIIIVLLIVAIIFISYKSRIGDEDDESDSVQENASGEQNEDKNKNNNKK